MRNHAQLLSAFTAATQAGDLNARTQLRAQEVIDAPIAWRGSWLTPRANARCLVARNAPPSRLPKLLRRRLRNRQSLAILINAAGRKTVVGPKEKVGSDKSLFHSHLPSTARLERAKRWLPVMLFGPRLGTLLGTLGQCSPSREMAFEPSMTATASDLRRARCRFRDRGMLPRTHLHLANVGYSTVATTSVKSSQLASPATCIARVFGFRSDVQWLRAANNSSSAARGEAAITHDV